MSLLLADSHGVWNGVIFIRSTATYVPTLPIVFDSEPVRISATTLTVQRFVLVLLSPSRGIQLWYVNLDQCRVLVHPFYF